MSFSRRDFLKITALAGAAAGLSVTAARRLLEARALTRVAETHSLMGTIVNFVLLAETRQQGREAIQATVTEMRRLIRLYDHRLPDGPLGQLNSDGHLAGPPAELVQVLRQALFFGAVSGGAFDITVKPLVDAWRAQLSSPPPALSGVVDYRLLRVTDDEIALARPGMAVTLDGIAKGSVVDSGAAFLQKSGFPDVLVEAGGDLMARSQPDGPAWKIGIAHPRQPNQVLETITVQNQAVATSGDYMNAFRSDFSAYHIIDPRTGQSPTELASATAIAPGAAAADALSTTLMVLGARQGLALIDSLPDAAALLITKDLQIIRSAKFPHAEME